MQKSVTRLVSLLALVFFFGSYQKASALAYYQLIHNSPDLSNTRLDIYINNTRVLDNFSFRSATPVQSVPGGTTFEIRICGDLTTDTTNSRYFMRVTLADNSKTAFVILGNSNPAYTNAANRLRILTVPNIRYRSTTVGSPQAILIHGIPDAPIIDATLSGTGVKLADNLSFGQASAYSNLSTSARIAELLSSNEETRLLQADVDFSLIPDTTSLLIMASGYLNEPQGTNGRPSQIMAVLQDGSVFRPSLISPTTARVQIIHNSPSPAASIVDIWIDGARRLDNVAFRTASPFLTLSGGTEHRVQITSSTATDTIGAVLAGTYTFTSGQQYQVIASGVVGQSVTNPDNFPTALNLLAVTPSRELVANGDSVNFRIIHNVPDAPTVDIRVGATTLVDNLFFSNYTNYLSVPANNYNLEMTSSDGQNVIARFPVNLRSFSSKSITVLASGFLNPAPGQAALSLTIIDANGIATTIAGIVPQAKIQVIHNSPDAAASLVDVYINGNLELDNVAFRTATGFIDVPSGRNLAVVIAPSNSTSASQGIYTTNYTLAEGSKTILIANGVINTSNYVENPTAGRNNAFRLTVLGDAQNTGVTGSAKFAVVHGGTDAGRVGISAAPSGAVVYTDTLSFGNTSPYLTLPATSTDFYLTPRPLIVYTAPLQALNDSAFVILASGFLTNTPPQRNTPFELYAVTASGRFIRIPFIDNSPEPLFANLQVIHNCADTLASSVDIYVNGRRELDNVDYRTATPYFEVFADSIFTIVVAPGNSNSVADGIYTTTASFAANTNNILIAEGLITPASYRPNPTASVSTAFRLRKITNTVINSGIPGSMKLAVIHGSTDAPQVGINASPSSSVLIPDTLGFGEFAGYLTLPSVSTSFYLTPLPNLIFTAPLQTLGDSGIVVVASGFLDATGNQASKPFSLLAITPAGRVIALPVVNSTKSLVLNKDLKVYPNPIEAGNVHFTFTSSKLATYQAQIMNVSGQVISTENLGTLDSGNHEISLTKNLTSGMYLIKLSNELGESTALRFTVK